MSCSRRASRRRNTRQRSSGIHTDSSSPDHNKRANVRSSSRSVFARACVIPVSSGLTTTTRSTCGSRNPGDLPTTAGHLQRHAIRRQKALRQTPDALRRARHSSAGAHLAVLTDRDHAEVTVNVQTDRSTDPPRQRHPHLHQLVDVQRENPAGQRHRPIRARSTIQASRRGGRTKSPGSKPIAQTGLPACVLPQKPLCRIARRYGRTRTQSLQPAFSCREKQETDGIARLLSRLPQRDSGRRVRRCRDSGHENPARELRPAPCVRSGDPGRGPFIGECSGQAVVDDALRARAFHWAAPCMSFGRWKRSSTCSRFSFPWARSRFKAATNLLRRCCRTGRWRPSPSRCGGAAARPVGACPGDRCRMQSRRAARPWRRADGGTPSRAWRTTAGDWAARPLVTRPAQEHCLALFGSATPRGL
jgi:hypothetical protein